LLVDVATPPGWDCIRSFRKGKTGLGKYLGLS
jgi:hypothetical protein